MAATRLDNDERRAAIIAAAVPLFARKGFSGTTTREIAEAANVSEALLFKHFPSKKRLYGEILRLGCEGDPALERLADLDARLRLLLHSYIEDGEYARELFERVFERVHPLFAASVAAAIAAGDLQPTPVASTNQFWFAQHVVAMIAFGFLPGRACVPYEGGLEGLVEQASRFILRGIGLADAVIEALLAELCESTYASDL